MTDRVEEIQARVERATRSKDMDEAGLLLLDIARSDIPFLLSEIQRLRKVEEAAREVTADYATLDSEDAPVIICFFCGARQPYTPSEGYVETHQTDCCLVSLRNALESHVAGPVREEMEKKVDSAHG